MAEPVDNHEADVFISQLWRHIYQRMAALMHPHARAHEPGGMDPVELPIGFLMDVTISSPVIGQAIVCTAADNAGGSWENGAGGGGGGGTGLAFFQQVGVLAPGAAVPGPINITGADATVSRVLFDTDADAVLATLTIGSGTVSCSLSAPGTDDHAGLTESWTADTALGLSIASVTGGTYFNVKIKAG